MLLLVEVADTSQRYDRPVKARRVSEVWIVDLLGGIVEVCRHPTPSGYGQVEQVGRGGAVAPVAFPDIVLSVDTILVLPSPTEE